MVRCKPEVIACHRRFREWTLIFEHPARWPNVHHGLISEIEAELNRILRPRYFASVEERVYLSNEFDPGLSIFIPDIRITAGASLSTAGPGTIRKSSAIGTIEPVDVTTLIDLEIHEAYIEIVDAERRNAVCVVEVLSPTNKVHGSAGRENYFKKRREVVGSPSHLVEIDLLRSGSGVILRGRLQPHDYVVTVSRKTENDRRTKAWAIPMNKPLPVIPIPLRGNDPDCNLGLQPILNSVYDRGAFDLKVDYNLDPVPALTPEQSTWARSLISKHSQT